MVPALPKLVKAQHTRQETPSEERGRRFLSADRVRLFLWVFPEGRGSAQIRLLAEENRQGS